MTRYLSGYTLAICLLANTGLQSQTPPPLFTDAAAFVHQVTIGPAGQNTRYRQIVSPVVLSVPIAFGNLQVQSAYMRLERENSVGAEDVTGPLDTQVSGEFDLGHAMFTGYVNIPTGSDSLNALESDLAQALARNDLNFPIKTLGQGLDVGGALTLARQVNHWALSVGGGYVARGRYAPFAGDPDYDPGDELTFTAGAGYAFGGWTFGLDLSGKLKYVDRSDRDPVFRNGKQLIAKGSLNYDSERIRLDATITEIARLKNREIKERALRYELDDSNGNDLRARGVVTVIPLPGVTVFCEAELKDVSKNGYDPTDLLYMDASRLWAYGGGVSLKIGVSEALTVRVIRGEGWVDGRSEDVETLNARISVRFFF